jgi:uncharacterized lipoprotein YbaY
MSLIARRPLFFISPGPHGQTDKGVVPMRFPSLLLLTSVVAASWLAPEAGAQDAGGISSSAISRCAGKFGLDTRQSDAAFGAIALDGVPWVTIERTEDMVGAQAITTTVTGTGAQRRRDGTFVPFRFTCVLDAKGEALMFHTSHLIPRLGDVLPPSIVVGGSAATAEKTPLPRGTELRVQLLDMAKSPAGEVLTEQVVRSGWQAPIPFALHLPKDTSLEGRKLAITARLVVLHQVLFQLKEPHVLASDALRKPVDLTLAKVAVTER